jgi:hypothetical protein
MSGNSALAAARRRRGTTEAPPPANTKVQNRGRGPPVPQTPQTPQTPQNPLAILGGHDRKLFNLERKLQELEEIMVSKTDLESLELNSDNKTNNITDNITLNRLDTNNRDVQQVKKDFLEMKKSLQELNSLVTTLRASLLNQIKEVDNLKDLKVEVNNLVEQVNLTKKDQTDNDSLGQMVRPTILEQEQNELMEYRSEGSESDVDPVFPEESMVPTERKRGRPAKAGRGRNLNIDLLSKSKNDKVSLEVTEAT